MPCVLNRTVAQTLTTIQNRSVWDLFARSSTQTKEDREKCKMKLSHFSLETPKMVTGKQYRPRSDAASFIEYLNCYADANLILALLNKLLRPLLVVNQSDCIIQIVNTNSHTEWQAVRIQISRLLQKPTDLDQHYLKRQGISRFSRTRVRHSKSV